MVIMSEWVYGNGRRQRRGEEVSNVFSVKFSLSLDTAASSLSMHLYRLEPLSVVCIYSEHGKRCLFLAVN